MMGPEGVNARISNTSRWLGLFTGILFLGLSVAIAVVGWGLARGHMVAVVEGDSMQPTIPRGSFAWISPASLYDIKVGDVVAIDTNRSDERLVLHRVVSVVDQGNGLFFQTAGDASEAPDARLVESAEIRGTLRAYIPMLGAPFQWAGSIWAKAALLAVIVGVFVVKSRGRRGRGSGPVTASAGPLAL